MTVKKTTASEEGSPKPLNDIYSVKHWCYYAFCVIKRGRRGTALADGVTVHYWWQMMKKSQLLNCLAKRLASNTPFSPPLRRPSPNLHSLALRFLCACGVHPPLRAATFWRRRGARVTSVAILGGAPSICSRAISLPWGWRAGARTPSRCTACHSFNQTGMVRAAPPKQPIIDDVSHLVQPGAHSALMWIQ